MFHSRKMGRIRVRVRPSTPLFSCWFLHNGRQGFRMIGVRQGAAGLLSLTPVVGIW